MNVAGVGCVISYLLANQLQILRPYRENALLNRSKLKYVSQALRADMMSSAHVNVSGPGMEPPYAFPAYYT